MQSLLGLTTSLVTLSVHDSLTFDGVEIALNPDIFTASSKQHSRDSSAYTHSRDASYSSAILTPNTTTSILVGNTHGASTPGGNPDEFNLNKSPSMASPETPLVGGGIYDAKLDTCFQAGDIIEIRVWDKKQQSHDLKNESNKTNSSLKLRQENLLSTAAMKLQQNLPQQHQHKKSSSFSSSVFQPLSESLRKNSENNIARGSKIPLRPPKIPPRPNATPRTSPRTQKTGMTVNLSEGDETAETGSIGAQGFLLPPGFAKKIDPTDGDETDIRRTISGPKPFVNLGWKMPDGASLPEASHSRISSLGSFTSATGGTPPSDVGNDHLLDQLTTTHTLRLKFVASVTSKSLSALKPGGRTQISIMRNVADLYDLSSYDMVTVTKIHNDEEDRVLSMNQADFVTLTVKDQFISRGEMYHFQNSFQGKWIYAGERLSTQEGIRGSVIEIRHGNEEYKSGFITENSKITFRTRSARITWLVQLSSEMWSYASPYETRGNSNQSGDGTCEIYFDKFVSFMYRLFEKWRALEVTHSLTVVFFSRTYITMTAKGGSANVRPQKSSAIRKDADGRLYEDHYKVVVENETRTDWETLIAGIKKNFISYPSEVGWTVSSEVSKLPSVASQGNILEAINTALNMLRLHYIDRDLQRCGNSVVVVSAGSGVFEVDARLAAITKQRMMDNGIGSDMLSLGLPPLHVAPFMLYRVSAEGEQQGTWSAKAEIPHWMHLSFFNYDRVGQGQESLKNTVVQHQNIEEDTSGFKICANGFVVHQKNCSVVNRMEEVKSKQNNPKLAQNQLNFGRHFEDILEACRPKSRGLANGRVPPPLLSQLKFFGLVGSKNSNAGMYEKNQQANMKSLLPGEWGTIRFEDTPPSPSHSTNRSPGRSPGRGSLNQCLDSSHMMRSGSGSDLSHSTASSFTTNLSLILGRSPSKIHHASPTLKLIQIQQGWVQLPLGLLNVRRRNAISQDSLIEDEDNDVRKDPNERKSSSASVTTMSTNGVEKKRSLSAMRKGMELHDENIFPSDTNFEVDVEKRPERNRQTRPTQSVALTTLIPSKPSEESGIGAAISQFNTANVSQYDRSAFTKTPAPIQRSESFALSTLKRSINTAAASTANLRYQQPMNQLLTRPHSLGFSFDGNYGQDPSIGLNVSRHDTGLLLSSSPSNPSYPPSFLPLDLSNQTNQNPLASLLKAKPQPAIDEKEALLSTSSPILRGNQPPDQKQDRQAKVRSMKKPISIVKNIKQKQAPPPMHHSRRKPWVLNPFRQEDEEELLAKRTHNSRRWSHVFPQGEREFKRHAGPNWRSLSQPAILPVTIDVHPTPNELNDLNLYSFNHYQVNLDAMDLTYYNSHSELLMEMVRQRIVQDFQLVPQNVLNKSRRGLDQSLHLDKTRRDDMDWKSTKPSSNSPREAENNIQHTLSMGHRIHIISCNPQSDSVEVVQYLARFASNKYNTYSYHYNIWMPATEKYKQVSQTFQRYPEEYPWNRLDNLICGDLDRTLSNQTRYRRIAFCIIPDNFNNLINEEDLLKKMKRFVEFLEKLAKKDLGIKMVSSHNRQSESSQEGGRRRRFFGNSAIHFIVHMSKKSRDKYEWLEMAVDKIFDTKKTYRVMFKWLVASATKVDGQVQMFKRRCTQIGLNLVNISHASSESNLFLNPFRCPENTSAMKPESAHKVERALIENFGFCDDGKHIVYPRDVETAFGIRVSEEGGLWSRRISVQQYIHRSGTLYIRLLHDTNKYVTFIIFENRRCTGSSAQLQSTFMSTFRDLNAYLEMTSRKG